MHRINSGFVAQLVKNLEGEGLDSLRLCRQAGIDAALLKQPDGFVPRADAYRLMMLAQAESGDPDIGLRAYRHFLPGGFQLVGYTMMSSPNLQGALESLVRYLPLLGTGVQLGLSREEGGQRLWAIDDLEAIEKPRAFEDAGLAVVLGFCRWLTGGSLPRLREIEFTYPEPADTTEHRRLFDCSLRFGAPRIGILFDREALSHPLSTANEALALLHGRFAEHRMDQLRKASYSERTRAWLVERLSLGGYDMGTVAKGLEVSTRTLQRGLAREGANFRDVLDGARRQLADYYLRNTSYSMTHVGDLLGFREASSFHKACLRWFGMPPGRYRTELSEAGFVASGVRNPDAYLGRECSP
ncbi:AraC family transcriptional regulator [Ectopseudomonas toyotomiensis]|jgi:AraC-like DNA-binding protein|uniref:AraC family transcriptional regulator n=1 Tax=Ectopseudomonas toyotomiensis TaxID=554344 RepID=A0AA42IRF9_9GAMM|nr:MULTISPECIES: AraC family transcriptional regulator [Pseudomonas]MBG0843395.1 AraC family transcriptional regulator [Pseudomonas toyotomiensis]MDH0704170.1 AraC family transcriptional regulator [Pseudomonas toyotomiensis]HCF6385809.1 AraC family transcriptional regulator [Pseudomonas aeruginosa]